MGQQVEIEKAERLIKDAEIRLHTIQSQLNIIELDHAKLSHIKNILESNIQSLKKDKIIALAGQYKRSKLELAKVNAHFNVVTNNKVAVTRMRNEALALVNRCKKEYETLIDSFKNNVLFGKFGRG